MVIEYNDPAYLFFIVTRLLLLEVFLIFGLFFIKQFISFNKERLSERAEGEAKRNQFILLHVEILRK